MIQLKTIQDIEIMKQGGLILSSVLDLILKRAQPGISLRQLDSLAEQSILAQGAMPSFKTVKGYKWTICSCVNDVVVHGTPTDYLLKEKDILGLDCGIYYKGYHTDSAWTKKIDLPKGGERIKNRKNENDGIDEFLNTGKKALQEALKQVKIGNHIYDISTVIQKTIEDEGYSVVRTLVGHGIGKNLHEEPEIPGYVKEKRNATPEIVPGMVLAVEVIYNMGDPEVKYYGNDGWTIITKDGKISGLFEITVAATAHGSVVLTPFISEEI